MTTPSTELLWAYAKGELSAQEAARVKAQVDASTEARAALADVEASLAVLSLLPPVPPMPDALARRVGDALAEHADQDASRAFTGWWRRLFSVRVLVPVMTACALALGVVWLTRAPSDAGPAPVLGPVALKPLEPLEVPSPKGRAAKPVKAVVASAKGARLGAATLAKAQVVAAGARVSTERGGSLWLKLPDGTKAGVTGESNVLLTTLDEHAVTMNVEKGSLAMVVPHREDRLLTVKAGPVEIKDLGTRFLVSNELARVIVAVEEGSVEVKTPTSTQVLSAGHAVAWHDGTLDAYAWPTSAPETPPLPTGSSPVAAHEAPPETPAPTVSADEEVDVEPANANPEDEWAQPPSGASTGAPALTAAPPPPPPPLMNGPPSQVTTVQPANRVPPPRRERWGFSLRMIEENLRELERQARFPFSGLNPREAQARNIARLADAGDCQGALVRADEWLAAPMTDPEEETLRRTVLHQKVRCLNHLGRTAEAAELQQQLSR